MADERSQVEEETSWWAFDAFADSELPSMSIDEPLEWPDSLPWEQFSAAAAPVEPPQTAPPSPADLVFPADAAAAFAADPAPVAPPGADLEWQAGGYDAGPTVASTPLAGLGGATGPAPADDAPAVEPLPESIWSYDGGGDSDGHLAGLATLAAPLAYADTDGRSRSGWPRLNVRRGNVAVVALISAASLVLLGMFLSVRSRNDLPSDATGSPPRTDQIATANTRIPPPTTSVVTTTVPGPVINIADLVPPAEGTTGGGTAGGGGGTAGASGTGSAATTPVATTAPARSSAAPAGGATTGTTQPAAQSTATTAAPEPPPPEPPAQPSPPPPADNNTVVTTQPRTTTSFTMPSIPDYTIPPSATSIPNRPSNNFSLRDN